MNRICPPSKNMIKSAILDMIRKRGNVTFAEFRDIPGFLGDCAMFTPKENNLDLIWWMGMSPEAVRAIEELLAEKAIDFDLVIPPVPYLVDGCCLNLPILSEAMAKSKKRKSRKRVWAPMVFNIVN